MQACRRNVTSALVLDSPFVFLVTSLLVHEKNAEDQAQGEPKCPTKPNTIAANA